MHVCNLVTNDDAPFYRQQLDAVAGAGVETTTLSVSDPADGGDRSPLAYAGLVGALRRRDLDRFDLVHANYGLTAPAALAQRSLPVVISLWGSDLAGPVGRVSRACARLADATIVMSRSGRDHRRRHRPPWGGIRRHCTASVPTRSIGR